MKKEWPKALSELPAVCKHSRPINFMLVNCGNGFTHHVIRDGRDLFVEDGGKHPSLAPYLVKTNPVHARVPYEAFNRIFPKAFFVPYHDLAITEPLYFPGTPFCIGKKLSNHFV